VASLHAVPRAAAQLAERIDCSDVAAVAAAVLTQDSQYGHAYLATGEQALSVDDVATYLSNAFARAIRDIATSLWRRCVPAPRPGRP
jgi:nucleoside-diphosphate-sugar epimerase